MLIGTNTDMTYKEIRYGLGDISVGDYQPIYDKDQVCKYVVKYFGRDVDYDLFFKDNSSLNVSSFFCRYFGFLFIFCVKFYFL